MCTVCSYPNDAGFKYCQACGEKKVEKCEQTLENDYLVERRLNYLDSLVDQSAYMIKKSALQKEFEKFLIKTTGKSMFTATPYDVKCF